MATYADQSLEAPNSEGTVFVHGLSATRKYALSSALFRRVEVPMAVK